MAFKRLKPFFNLEFPDLRLAGNPPYSGIPNFPGFWTIGLSIVSGSLLRLYLDAHQVYLSSFIWHSGRTFGGLFLGKALLQPGNCALGGAAGHENFRYALAQQLLAVFFRNDAAAED
jgi:hypothetical protein